MMTYKMGTERMTPFWQMQPSLDNNRDLITWEPNTWVSLDKCSPQKRKDALKIISVICITSSTFLPRMPIIDVNFKLYFRKTKPRSDLVLDFEAGQWQVTVSFNSRRQGLDAIDWKQPLQGYSEEYAIVKASLMETRQYVAHQMLVLTFPKRTTLQREL